MEIKTEPNSMDVHQITCALNQLKGTFAVADTQEQVMLEELVRLMLALCDEVAKRQKK